MHLSPLTALSTVDGRYADRLLSLRPIFSEWGLTRRRIVVEIRWLEALADHPQISEVPPLSTAARTLLAGIETHFGEADAEAIKAIEKSTNHDVKAVEYYLKQRLAVLPELARVSEFVHFACTSEDINNLAYALMLKDARERLLLPELKHVELALRELAERHAALPMLSRTHGQSASPTTVGKELRNVVERLRAARDALATLTISGKFNGAVGNYNAHRIAYPEVDWLALSQQLIAGLGLTPNLHTTQIEPHDGIAQFLDACARIDTILIDLCRDLWGYISLGYFRQAAVTNEVGSSTMPHKINPIDFENAEGNFGIANALFRHLADKLPLSRFQRDLTDSTTLRALGTAFGHQWVALASLKRGLARIEPDPQRLAADLAAAPEVLAEAIQTVMRRHGLAQPYERLKALTRGRAPTLAELRGFVAGLELPEDIRARLIALEPADYTGYAAELAIL